MDTVIKDIISIEVDEDSNLQVQQSKIGSCLFPEYILHLFDTLQFHDDSILYQKI